MRPKSFYNRFTQLAPWRYISLVVGECTLPRRAALALRSPVKVYIPAARRKTALLLPRQLYYHKRYLLHRVVMVHFSACTASPQEQT